MLLLFFNPSFTLHYLIQPQFAYLNFFFRFGICYVTCTYRTFLAMIYFFHMDSAQNYLLKKILQPTPPRNWMVNPIQENSPQMTPPPQKKRKQHMVEPPLQHMQMWSTAIDKTDQLRQVACKMLATINRYTQHLDRQLVSVTAQSYRLCVIWLASALDTSKVLGTSHSHLWQ